MQKHYSYTVNTKMLKYHLGWIRECNQSVYKNTIVTLKMTLSRFVGIIFNADKKNQKLSSQPMSQGNFQNILKVLWKHSQNFSNLKNVSRIC